jgi:hypothetical protein
MAGWLFMCNVRASYDLAQRAPVSGDEDDSENEPLDGDESGQVRAKALDGDEFLYHPVLETFFLFPNDSTSTIVGASLLWRRGQSSCQSSCRSPFLSPFLSLCDDDDHNSCNNKVQVG